MKQASKKPTKSLRIIFAFLLIVQPIIIMSLEGIDSIKYILVLSSIPLIAIYILMIFYISKNVLKTIQDQHIFTILILLIQRKK